jgi:transcriptional regulator with XRE-family HTH domain
MKNSYDQMMEDPKTRVDMCVESTLVGVVEHIARVMESDGLNQADLAKRLGLTEGRISQMLAGSANLTLKSVATMLAGLNRVLSVNSEPIVSASEEILQPWTATSGPNLSVNPVTTISTQPSEAFIRCEPSATTSRPNQRGYALAA